MPQPIDDTIIAAVKKAREDGCPIPGDDAGCERIANVAARRMRSFARRNPNVSAQRDPTKGLIEQLEPEPTLVGPLAADYEYLAGEILAGVAKKAK